jgi:uncharacterized protein
VSSTGDGVSFSIPSPCVGVCRVDESNRLCVGCLRTIQEIVRWPRADDRERLGIVQRLRDRRRAIGRTSEADSRPRRRHGGIAPTYQG